MTPPTIILRLFSQSDPTREIEHRALTRGELVVGRDREAGWVIPDPTKTLSRLHCVFAVENGAVTLRDDSTNGVFPQGGERLARGVATPVAPGDSFTLGAFLIRVEARRSPGAQPQDARAATLPVVSDGSAAGKLLDAFCLGAQIDSSVLSGEDPTEVMRRLGGIYRQMVLGLGALMDERTRAKAAYGLERTTVQALDNNPFRWAPPLRVAVDLLQSRQDGFLSSEAAVRASFDDLKEHNVGLAAGSRAAVEAVLETMSPDTLADPLKGQSFLMKKRTETLWAEHQRAYEQASDDLRAWRDGPVSQAFREAYNAIADGEPPQAKASEAQAPQAQAPEAKAAPADEPRSFAPDGETPPAWTGGPVQG